jgi:hypothetical protein
LYNREGTLGLHEGRSAAVMLRHLRAPLHLSPHSRHLLFALFAACSFVFLLLANGYESLRSLLDVLASRGVLPGGPVQPQPNLLPHQSPLGHHRGAQQHCLLQAEQPHLITLPQHFRRNGYFTIGMGKVFHIAKTPGAEYTSSSCSGQPRLRARWGQSVGSGQYGSMSTGRKAAAAG